MRSKDPAQFDLLCAYVEPFADARRIVVVGKGAARLGERLLELGARTVHAYEVASDRANGAGPVARGLVVKPLPRDDFDVRDGAFDLALVPNVAEVPSIEDLMTRLRRVVGSEGVVVACTRADSGGDAPGYYELYDLVALQFAHVTMVGQVPFTGAALAVLGENEEEPEVTVDTQLASGAEPPTWFFAVASERPVDVRPYVIVQSEMEAAEASAPVPAAAPVPAPDANRGHIEVAQARLRADVLETQLEEQRRVALENGDAARRFEQDFRAQQKNTKMLEDTVRVLEVRLGEAADILAQQRDLEAKQLDFEARQLEATVRAQDLENALARARALEESAVRAEQAATMASALEGELVELVEGHAAEVALLEEALRERGRAIHALEREVVRRDALVKELLLTLEAQSAVTSLIADETAPAARAAVDAPEEMSTDIQRLVEERAQLRANLESLAAEAARREGELQALRWRIEELEIHAPGGGATGERPTADAPKKGDEDERDELDMLRQALKQEHDARIRAENGEELQSARAEIQRQAALLAQLRAERERIGEESRA